MLNHWLLDLVQLVLLSLAGVFLFEKYRLSRSSKYLCVALAFGGLAAARYVGLIARTPHVLYWDHPQAWWLPVFGQVAECYFYLLFWIGVVKATEKPAVNEPFLTSFVSRLAFKTDEDTLASKTAKWKRVATVAGTVLLTAFALVSWHLFRSAGSSHSRSWGEPLLTTLNAVLLSGILFTVGLTAYNWRQIWARNALYLLLFAKVLRLVNFVVFQSHTPELLPVVTSATFLGFAVLAVCHMRLGLQAKVAVSLLLALGIPGLAIVVALGGGLFPSVHGAGAASSPGQAVSSDMVRSVYILTGTGIATAGFLGYLFARRLLMPLMDLVRGTEALAHGDLHHRVSNGRRDEYGDLARSFNLMTRNLRVGVCELKEILDRTREAYRRDIDIQKEILISGKLELQRVALLGRLAGSVAQQLDSCSDKVTALMKDVLQGLETDRPDRENARRLLAEAERLTSMHKSFTELSKAGVPSFTPLNVNDQIRDAVELIQHQLEEDNVKIRLDLGDNLTPVFGASQELQQVFLNLALNAKDAMPTGGVLRIRSRQTDYAGRESRIEIEFSDTGIGIPEQWLCKIFDPFFTRKLTKKSAGLGLAISKAIVESHGGSISVHSKQGQGSTFAIWLPAGAGNGCENGASYEEAVDRELPFPEVGVDDSFEPKQEGGIADEPLKVSRRPGKGTGHDRETREIYELAALGPDSCIPLKSSGGNGTSKPARGPWPGTPSELACQQNATRDRGLSVETG